jgi:hypothetical protein
LPQGMMLMVDNSSIAGFTAKTFVEALMVGIS